MINFLSFYKIIFEKYFIDFEFEFFGWINFSKKARIYKGFREFSEKRNMGRNIILNTDKFFSILYF